MKPLIRSALVTSCALGALSVANPAMAVTGEEVLENTCAACHAASEDGGYERIDAVRKTPEGWDMTVARMMRNHDVHLEADERDAIVRYLSDTRGLTLQETAERRYILEREPVAFDTGPDDLMTQTCGRCHSYARVALQRRSAEDWQHLVNFHLGQFPTLEYQALARDRDWWGIAKAEIIPFLAKTYPLGDAPAAFAGDASGDYLLAGRQPGRGDYTGTLVLAAAEGDYDVTMVLNFADGSRTFTGTGRILGEGEWRATLSDGTTSIRQVFAITEDGRISGRWYETDRDMIGGRITAVPADGTPEVLAATPTRVKIGQETVIRVAGPGLGDQLTLPAGVQATVTPMGDGVTEVTVTATTEPGPFALKLGDQTIELVAYTQPDRISVVPDMAMARIGGGGGAIPKAPAQFEAWGWLNGPDKEPATEDDIALGVFDASWQTDNFDEAAAAMEDAKFAGKIDEHGLFMPADAGPNPERPMKTNNAGNLKVIATVDAGEAPLTAEAHLYATVQRFVDAPIR
ncbi:quinohemoprotein amine dehydrogenase subunit alpha [Paracoccus seriniphilus]|uniref:Quinohemoprotein amine dehydrogenase n=1 Tax=Paracoccus seriniphilus TaxID=184748 RepID=A0A239Q1N1_9RHOB|nr:quinohemoprotein amine dehydrogenase subunit alpha [Paracoccus seriniphilus]WCR15917.1 quinohemoprotein amine dehydrogenase subunit alpha [Paracoccus seriniphilus]SNT76340.1 quinohemoprotein amine dehydrogenase [Paracoccus seriniphilus]